MKWLRITPAVQEQPPLDVRVGGDERYDYIMRRDKKIKRGTLKGKLGRLVMQSTQPKSLRLPNPKRPDDGYIPTTIVRIFGVHVPLLEPHHEP